MRCRKGPGLLLKNNRVFAPCTHTATTTYTETRLFTKYIAKEKGGTILAVFFDWDALEIESDDALAHHHS